MTVIKGLDHVAVAVRDTEAALAQFAVLGLPVVASEEIQRPHVRLTYIDCGNATIQLVEPLDDAGPLVEYLASAGEGLHHICFAVEDVEAGATALATDGSSPATIGEGRGRPSAFVAGPAPAGVRIEVTESAPAAPGEEGAG